VVVDHLLIKPGVVERLLHRQSAGGVLVHQSLDEALGVHAQTLVLGPVLDKVGLVDLLAN